MDPKSLYSHYKKLLQIRLANAVFTDLKATITTVQNGGSTSPSNPGAVRSRVRA